MTLIVPGLPAAIEPIARLFTESIAGTVMLVLRPDATGPDAESALIDFWIELDEDIRSRVRVVIGRLAGVLARFTDLRTQGFALLSPVTGPTPNAQSRSLLMAFVPDTWSLALDETPPIDAGAWRERLRSAPQRDWTIAVVSNVIDTIDVASQIPALHVTAEASQRVSSTLNTIGDGVDSQGGPVGWLDIELFGLASMTRLAFRSVGSSVPADPQPRTLASKVVRGRNGRLFLTRDSHDSHRQITGGRPLDDEELAAWASGMTERLSSLRAIGCEFRQLIGPAPQVVHPEDLPDGQTVASRRPVQQVLSRLEMLDPAPCVLYPLEALREAAAFRDPYSKTDSHWNDLGTFVGYETLLDTLTGLQARRLERNEVSFHETCYVGDLGEKLSPQRASIFLRGRIDRPRARMVEDNRVRNHGRRATFACDAAPPITCMVFGDSWAYSLMLFLAESFRRVVFCHRVNVVDHDAVARERPDLVLSIMTERFCTALPLDREAVPFERVASKKLAVGDVVPTQEPASLHNFLFSLELERGLNRPGGVYLPPRG